MNVESHRSPLMKYGRKKNGFRRFWLVTLLRDHRTSVAIRCYFLPSGQVGLHPRLRASLQVVMPVLPHDALKRQAEHFYAERVLVAVGLHIGQIGVIEVALRLKRPDAGVPYI